MATKLSKITIIRGTVFDKNIVEEGDVIDVTDNNRADAQYLVNSGKAVEGAQKVKKSAPLENKVPLVQTQPGGGAAQA